MSQGLARMLPVRKVGETGNQKADSVSHSAGGDNVPNRIERPRMPRSSSAPPLAMLSENIIRNKSLPKRRSASVPVRSVPLAFGKCKNKILQLFGKFFNSSDAKLFLAPNFNNKIIFNQSISDSSEITLKSSLKNLENSSNIEFDKESEISHKNNNNINNIFSSNSSNINFSNFSFNVLSEDLNAFENFLETLKKSNPVQYNAELRNLAHIASCAEEMLKPTFAGGLGFKPEFVALVIHVRLQIAMFFSGTQTANFGKSKEKDTKEVSQIYGIICSNDDELNDNNNSSNTSSSMNLLLSGSTMGSTYFPACMFDFGPERAKFSLKSKNDFDDKYHESGRAASPDVFENSKQEDFSSSSFDSLSLPLPRSGDLDDGESNRLSTFSFSSFLSSSEFKSAANKNRTHSGTEFSFLRGSANVSTSTDGACVPYTMPSDWDDNMNVQTMSLPERFRRFLQFGFGNFSNCISSVPSGIKFNGSNNNNDNSNNTSESVNSNLSFNVPNWNFDENTPLIDLPPPMMFLVGLQYGQINIGTWNEFTLAAKRYFALQTADDFSCNLNFSSSSSSSSSLSSSSSSSSSSLNLQEPLGMFFWQNGTNPNNGENYNSTALRAFKPLLDALEREKNSFSNVNNNNNNNNDSSGVPAKYSSTVPYFGIHGGGGYIYGISDSMHLDAYGKFIWTRKVGKDATLSSGEVVSFKDVDSSRLIAGLKLSRNISAATALHIGAACSYEFAGKIDGTVHGLSLDTPSLRGASAIAEVGISTKWNNFHVDLGTHGYLGKRRGIDAFLSVKHTF